VADIPYWSKQGVRIELVAAQPDGTVRIGTPQAATARGALEGRYGASHIRVEDVNVAPANLIKVLPRGKGTPSPG
jgi:hypothetical protein